MLVNTVVYVRDVLHRPDTDLALALACFGIGSMLVALFAPRVLERFGDRAVMLTGAAVIPVALAGATAVSFLAPPGAGWWLLLGLWFLLGAGNSTILTPSPGCCVTRQPRRPGPTCSRPSSPSPTPATSSPIRWPGGSARLPGWAGRPLALTILAI